MNTKLRILFIIICYLVTTICFADKENRNLQFLVIDKGTSKAINNISIRIKDVGIGSKTDGNGYLEYSLLKGNTYSFTLSGRNIYPLEIENIYLDQHLNIEVNVNRLGYCEYQIIQEKEFNQLRSNIENNLNDKKVIQLYEKRKYNSKVYGNYYDLNNFRLFMSPTARIIEEDKSYFSSHELLFFSFGFGFEDKLSFAAGSMIPIGSEFLPTTAGIKYNFYSKDDLYLAGSGGFISVDGNMIWHERFIATFGSIDNSLTCSVGSSHSRQFNQSIFNFTLGGVIRVARNVSLIMELNRYADEDGDGSNILIYGMRFFGSKISADLAFAKVLQETGDLFPMGFPLVNFTYFY